MPAPMVARWLLMVSSAVLMAVMAADASLALDTVKPLTPKFAAVMPEMVTLMVWPEL